MAVDGAAGGVVLVHREHAGIEIEPDIFQVVR
jgi:hypothetical protein